jgi:hypothetical protein
MVDPRVLEHFGCTQERLRKIFTAGVAPDTTADLTMDLNLGEVPKTPKTDQQINRLFRNRIRSRTLEGVTANLRAARPNQAVDLAADAAPIQRHTIPLMMWATGKIKIETAYSRCCAGGGTAQADRFFRKENIGDKQVISLNEQRITDIQIDLLKSYVTRRLAAMDALWSNLWPLFRYDPRGTDDVALLRADVLTQRVDIIADAYNYRHFFSQCRRQMLLYGWSVAFPRAAWDRKTSWRFKPTNTGEPSEEVESYVIREGVDFVNPHPSRIFWDLSAPLANLNTDTGPSYVGYWDVVPWRTLLTPGTAFFNLENVFVTNGWTDLATTYGEFFDYYFDACVMSWPSIDGPDPSLGNDIKANVGRYTSQVTDVGVLLTHYFEKVNPLVEGIGRYDGDVWLHLTVAGDCTVVAAEFLPSIPGAYGAVNCNDGRLANQSMAMALLSYQDQASNIMSSMLMQLRTSLIQLWLIDKDSLEPDIVEQFKKSAKDGDWWVDRKVLIYSASKLRDLGIQDPRMAFAVVQAQIQNVFDAGLKALTQLINLADRLLILSPNELGQPNPREVAAREVTEMATSVQAMNAFNNQGPREQIAAAKELIYDSLICCATQNFRVPVENRYNKAVIKDAGMEIPPEVLGRLNAADDFVPVKTPIMGSLRTLVYDYYFNSRDGAERVVNTQGAQVVMQVLQTMLQVPQLAQKMGVQNIMQLANTAIRMSGAPIDFQFETDVGGDDALPEDEDQQQQFATLQADVERMKALLMQMAGGRPGAISQGGAPSPAGGAPQSSPASGGENVALLQDPTAA